MFLTNTLQNSMEKYIFKKFTIENKILLTKEALELIKSSLHDLQEVDDVVLLYKSQSQLETVDFTMLKNILKNYFIREEVKNFSLNSWCYYKATREDRYNFLKDLLVEPIESIHELKENKPDKIFGILYKNKKNNYIVEDESGCIEVELSETNCFISDFVFLILEGIKKNDVFVVNKVGYLPIIKDKNKESEDFTKDILFFYGQFNEKIEFENKEVFLIHPETNYIREMALKRGCKVLDKNSYNLTNPLFVHVNSKTIALYCSEVFKNKEDGEFYGGGYVKSFLKTYLSQYDLSPFKPPHVYINSIPNAIIIFQDSYSFIENIDGVYCASVSPFRDTNLFLEYLTEADMFVLRSKKE